MRLSWGGAAGIDEKRGALINKGCLQCSRIPRSGCQMISGNINNINIAHEMESDGRLESMRTTLSDSIIFQKCIAPSFNGSRLLCLPILQ